MECSITYLSNDEVCENIWLKLLAINGIPDYYFVSVCLLCRERGGTCIHVYSITHKNN